MASTEVTRPTFWQIGHAGEIAFYVLSAVAVLVFLVGVARRIREYRRAAAEPVSRMETGDLPRRLRAWAGAALASAPVFDRDWLAGAWHVAVLWGFLTLLAATTILAVDIDIYRPLAGESFFIGEFYLGYSLVVDAMGLLFVIGVGVAAYRRHGRRLDRLRGSHTGVEDVLFLWGLLALGVGGYLVEAVRILGTGFPPFETVSFVGYAVATWLAAAGLTPTAATAAYPALWWSHALLALAFIAWIPYGKPFHMLTGALNAALRDDEAGRRLPAEDLDPETGDDDGLADVDDLSWKRLLDQDACTKCGRCSAACPANASGRPLDPQEVVLDLKAARGSVDDDRRVVGDGGTESVVDAEAMEACMSCMACMDACPVGVEHLTGFAELNRDLVERGAVDGNVQEVFEDVMRHGNVLGEPARRRPEWVEDLEFEVPDARDGPVEYLWYVGDYPSYDERNREVARALARVFEAANVDYGILYEAEVADGNDLRRLGEELLYVEQAATLVEAFETCEFETVVCTSPHAANTIRNEYAEIDFGMFADDPVMPSPVDGHWNADGAVDVRHYTEVVADLVATGELTVPSSLSMTVTYHDPCHLGRYNDVYEAPRELIQATGCELREMPRNRAESFCCGGGGGGLWLEQEQSTKPSEERLREAVEDTPGDEPVERFVVACPTCLTMYEDGRKTGGFEDDLAVVGVTELLAEALTANGGEVAV